MAPSQMRPAPLRTASGLDGFGTHHHVFSVPRDIAPTPPEQDADALRVARLERLGVPHNLAGTLAILVFGERQP